jgi:hypothetical protein
MVSKKIFFGVAVALAALPAAALAEKAWVQVRETKVRTQPLFYAAGTSTLRYGDPVEQVGSSGAWSEVRAAGSKGFLPSTVLSRNQIVLSSQDIRKVKADSGEIVLAGKGFSKEVENEFKAANADARYDLVDKVEKSARVVPSELAAFVKGGELK